jgi:hypothetical protein
MAHIPQAFMNAHSKQKAAPTIYTPQRPDATLEEMVDTHSVDTLSKGEETFDAEKQPQRISQINREDGEQVGKMDYEVWLPFAAKVYKISPKIEDYIIVNTLICPSDIPNRNGIAFPSNELATFHPPPMNRMTYKAWGGCPVHLEHDNEDHEKAYGVILDAALMKIQGYGGGKLWKVMGLLAIDKNKNPDIAQKVLTGKINTYSMGALVERFTCGYCGAECDSRFTCGHIQSTKSVNWKKYRDFDGSTHLAFLNAHSISPIECSIVADPAWAPALSDSVYDPWAAISNDTSSSEVMNALGQGSATRTL